MDSLSCYILTRNSEKYLPQILQQVKAVADEILLIDSGSTDRTCSIARKHGCRILYRTFDNFRNQRAFAQEQCKHDWVLLLDSDEIPSTALIAKLQQLKQEGFASDCYQIRREWNVLGRRVSVCFPVVCPDYPVRLLNRSVVGFDERGPVVHETPHGQRTTLHLEESIEHITFETKREMERKLQHYSSLAAVDVVARGKNRSWYKQYFDPVGAWLKWYLIKGAWKDGAVGWEMGIYAFRYTYLKYANARKADKKPNE